MNRHKWTGPLRITHVYHNNWTLQLKPNADPRQTDGTGDKAGPDLSQWIDVGTGQSADVGRPERTRAYNAEFAKWYIMGLALRRIYGH